MAHHKRHHHRRRRNPFGVNGALVKDVAFNAVGMAGATWGSSFLGQSGWLDVAATAAVAVAISYAGKSVAGAPASDELLKGGILAALLKAIKHSGVSIPGLGTYANSYFAVPTSSDAYGRTASPIALLPPAPKGVSGMGYDRYRSRFMTR